MSEVARPPPYGGLFSAAPTLFTESGALDLPSQRRCVDFMIDSGVDGPGLLAARALMKAGGVIACAN